ncbi:MAG: hypothetical protein ACRECY_07255, partial [Phyllobacterium sp.]
MIEVDLPDGTIAEFPEGTSKDIMRDALRRRFPADATAPKTASWDKPNAAGIPGGDRAPIAPKPEPTIMDSILGALDYGDDTGAIVLDGARRGISGMAALPGLAVDAVNNAPRLANLIPGVDGIGPI